MVSDKVLVNQLEQIPGICKTYDDNGDYKYTVDAAKAQQAADDWGQVSEKIKPCTNNMLVSLNGPEPDVYSPIPKHMSFVPGTVAKDGTRSQDHFYIDHIPVIASDFEYKAHDKTLIWCNAYGGGWLRFNRTFTRGIGAVGKSSGIVSIQVETQETYICDVAMQAGVEFEDNKISFTKDSEKWKAANWDRDRLKFQVITDTNPTGASVYRYRSRDLKSEGPFTMSYTTDDDEVDNENWYLVAGRPGLELVDGEYMFTIDYNSGKPATYKSCSGDEFPSNVIGIEHKSYRDIEGNTIYGGFLTQDWKFTNDFLNAFEGTKSDPLVAGYYLLENSNVPFSIFDGELLINDQRPFGLKSWVKGNELHWSGLSTAMSKKVKLPAQGAIKLSDDCSIAKGTSGLNVTARRLSPEAAINIIRSNPDSYWGLQAKIAANNFAIPGVRSELSLGGLRTMDPFEKEKDEDGEFFTDKIGEIVQGNMSDILSSFVDGNLWGSLFPGVPQPVLTGELDRIANKDVTGEDGTVYEATAFYKSLSTAVLVQAMADIDDPLCHLMNAPRAEQFLSDETSESPVYQDHMAQLFDLAWKEKFPDMAKYLDDEEKNIPEKHAEIERKYQLQAQNIRDTIMNDEEQMNEMLSHLATARSEAINRKKFWAFQLYEDETGPAALNNMAAMVESGIIETSFLSRHFQQNVNLLSVLDTDGYFVSQYIETLGLFFSEIILLAILDLDSLDNADALQMYLKQVVEHFENEVDPALKEEAEKMIRLFNDSRFQEMLRDSQSTLRAMGQLVRYGSMYSALSLFEVWFEGNYRWAAAIHPNFAKTFVAVGLSGMMMGLVSGYTNWEHLTDAERASLVFDTAFMAAQAAKNFIKKGYTLKQWLNGQSFRPQHLKASAAKAIRKFSLKKKVSAMMEGLYKLASSISGWFAVRVKDVLTRRVRNKSFTMNPDESARKKFSSKLDRGMASFITPAFCLAGVGFSFYAIFGDEVRGTKLAAEIINIVDSTLSIAASLGQMIKPGSKTVAKLVTVSRVLSVAAGIVGFALMLAELFKKPPNPVEEFFNSMVKPAGFDLDERYNSVEYFETFQHKEMGYFLLTTTFETSSKFIVAKQDAVPGSGPADNTMRTGFVITSDGQGRSMITTILQSDEDENQYEPHILQTTGGDSVKFTELKQDEDDDNTPLDTEQLEPLWKMNTVDSTPTLYEENKLFGIKVTIESVKESGKFLMLSGDGNVTLGTSKTVWDLKMSGLKPEGVYYQKVYVSYHIDNSLSYSPDFYTGVTPSDPLTWVGTGELPKGLQFNINSGELEATREKPEEVKIHEYKVVCTNPIGSSTTEFDIEVEMFDPGWLPPP